MAFAGLVTSAAVCHPTTSTSLGSGGFSSGDGCVPPHCGLCTEIGTKPCRTCSDNLAACTPAVAGTLRTCDPAADGSRDRWNALLHCMCGDDLKSGTCGAACPNVCRGAGKDLVGCDSCLAATAQGPACLAPFFRCKASAGAGCSEVGNHTCAECLKGACASGGGPFVCNVTDATSGWSSADRYGQLMACLCGTDGEGGACGAQCPQECRGAGIDNGACQACLGSAVTKTCGSAYQACTTS